MADFLVNFSRITSNSSSSSSVPVQFSWLWMFFPSHYFPIEGGGFRSCLANRLVVCLKEYQGNDTMFCIEMLLSSFVKDLRLFLYNLNIENILKKNSAGISAN